MKFDVLNITPDMAKKMLDKNIVNRAMSDRRIGSYAELMKNAPQNNGKNPVRIRMMGGQCSYRQLGRRSQRPICHHALGEWR